MIPKFVRGCIAPVFTAFHEDGRLDDDGQRALMDYLLQTGAVSAYFVRSGMGQMFTFNYDDVRQIAKTTCEHFAGKAPVLVGATGIWDRNRDALPDPALFTRQAVELSQYAESVGAAGVVHTVPEAIAPTGRGTCADVVRRYFETINAAVNIPVFIYQSPGTDDRYRITQDLVRKLADLPNIKGMKASTSDATYIFDITYAVSDKDFGFIVGNECAFLAGLVTGAKAVIGQGATVNPQILKAVQDRYERGDLEGAIEAQHSTNLLVERSKNTTVFFKRYITEKGYRIKPFPRTTKESLYGKDASLSEEDYIAYKRLLESELAEFAG